MALAEYNYDIALAAAGQNLELGERLFEVSVLGGGLPTDPGAELTVTRQDPFEGGLPLDPYSQSEFDTDKADAESAKEQALKAAGEVYANSHAAAAGARQQAIAAANSAYAASKTAADQTLVDTRGAENETYEHAVADREKQRVETNADLQATYDKQAASTRATEFADLATTTPSHFATLFSGMASLTSDFVDSAADTIADLKTNFAEHHRVFSHGQATDDKTTSSTLTSAANTFSTTVTSAFTTAADSTATLLNNLAALGAHLPFLPSVATAPTVVMPEVSQVTVDHFEDCTAPTSSATYTHTFDDILAEQQDWTSLIAGISASDPSTSQQTTSTATRLTTDRLDSGLVRDQVKPDESLYEGYTDGEIISALDNVKHEPWMLLAEHNETTDVITPMDVTKGAIWQGRPIDQGYNADDFVQFDDDGPEVQLADDSEAPAGARNEVFTPSYRLPVIEEDEGIRELADMLYELNSRLNGEKAADTTKELRGLGWPWQQVREFGKQIASAIEAAEQARLAESAPLSNPLHSMKFTGRRGEGEDQRVVLIGLTWQQAQALIAQNPESTPHGTAILILRKSTQRTGRGFGSTYKGTLLGTWGEDLEKDHYEVWIWNDGETGVKEALKLDAEAERLANRTPFERIRDEVLDSTQTVADYVGMIPVIGDYVDAGNAIVYLLRGKPGMAALSGIAVIPVFGSGVALGAKSGIRAVKKVYKQSEVLQGVVLLTRKSFSGLSTVAANVSSHVLSSLRHAPKGDLYSLALGLTQHPNHSAARSGLLMRFADKVDDTNVRHYWQLIDEMGLPNATVGKKLEGQLLDFMNNSKHIHLNLDGMLDTLDAAKLKEILKLGEQGTRVPQNITRWEFLQVWSKFRDKATFYFDGKAVDLTDLLK